MHETSFFFYFLLYSLSAKSFVNLWTVLTSHSWTNVRTWTEWIWWNDSARRRGAINFTTKWIIERRHSDPIIKSTYVETSGSERRSWFRNAARALFSSYVAPFSRLSFLPFVSRPADILAGRFPTRSTRLLRISSRQPSPRRSIDSTNGRRRMQGPFLRVRGERPHVPVSAIRSKNSRGQRERMAIRCISHINRKSSRMHRAVHDVSSSVNYYFIWISIRED